MTCVAVDVERGLIVARQGVGECIAVGVRRCDRAAYRAAIRCVLSDGDGDALAVVEGRFAIGVCFVVVGRVD